MFQYYLFDLDGTLTDPGLGITNSVMYALRACGIEPPAREELYSFIGPPLSDSFMRYYGMSQEEAAEAVRLYREYFADRGIFENQLYPEVPDMLARLKASGKCLSLATSKPEKFSVTILEHFDLSKYFDFVAAATMDESRNKKGDVISYALESLHIEDRSRVLMIGDRAQDIEGAKANGIASAGVLYGYGDYAELSGAGADYIVARPEEILTFEDCK